MSDDIVIPDTQSAAQDTAPMDTASEESPFLLAVSPSKRASAPLQKRIPPSGPSVSGRGLWEQLCAKGAAHSLAVDDWLQAFAAHESASVLQLINTIFWVENSEIYIP